jgi:hypothetical protein
LRIAGPDFAYREDLGEQFDPFPLEAVGEHDSPIVIESAV